MKRRKSKPVKYVIGDKVTLRGAWASIGTVTYVGAHGCTVKVDDGWEHGFLFSHLNPPLTSQDIETGNLKDALLAGPAALRKLAGNNLVQESPHHHSLDPPGPHNTYSFSSGPQESIYLTLAKLVEDAQERVFHSPRNCASWSKIWEQSDMITPETGGVFLRVDGLNEAFTGMVGKLVTIKITVEEIDG